MARRVSSSQLKSQLRQMEQKQRQAINDYNRAVRKVNDANKRAVDAYNREVRAYNARLRSNRQKLLNELARLSRLNSRQATVRYTAYQTSVQTLHRSFSRIEAAAEQGAWTAGHDLFDMAEGETANSVAVLNALLTDPAEEGSDDPGLRQTVITTELRDISADLDERWRGALFALSTTTAVGRKTGQKSPCRRIRCRGLRRIRGVHEPVAPVSNLNCRCSIRARFTTV